MDQKGRRFRAAPSISTLACSASYPTLLKKISPRFSFDPAARPPLCHRSTLRVPSVFRHGSAPPHPALLSIIKDLCAINGQIESREASEHKLMADAL